MTTFNDIYAETDKYKRGFSHLCEVLADLSAEKEKNAPVVAWFRTRRRLMNGTLEPLKIEINAKSKASSDESEINLLIDLTNRAIGAIEDGESSEYKALTKRIDHIYGMELGFNKRSNRERLEVLESVLSNFQETRKQMSKNGALNYKGLNEQIDALTTLIEDTPHATDLDVETINALISNINGAIKQDDFNVPSMREIPMGASNDRIDNLEDVARSAVEVIDSLVPMTKFNEAKGQIRLVIHDLGNNRGSRAFENRINGIIDAANKSIEYFNTHYWQISGQRWETIAWNGGSRVFGYKPVAVTHSPINEIEHP